MYLQHMAACIGRIESYVGTARETFFSQPMVQDAVIRQFEIIGEATKHLSPDFCAAHSGVPWKQMAGFRDVLIHQYFGVDLEQVWRVVIEEIPRLKEVVEEAIACGG